MSTTCLDLVANDEAPSVARHALKDALGEGVPVDVLGRVLLIVSEMITTALSRSSTAGSALQLRLEMEDRRLRVTVVDQRPPTHAAGGRFSTPVQEGLTFTILDRLSDRWGLMRTTHGATAWSEVDLR